MKFNVRGETKDLELTSVVLEYDPSLALKGLCMWHCPICREPVIQFSGKVVSIVPGEVPTKLPLIRECFKCKRKYLFVSIV